MSCLVSLDIDFPWDYQIVRNCWINEGCRNYRDEAVIFGWIAQEGLCKMQEIYTAVTEIGLHRDLMSFGQLQAQCE